VTNGFPTPPQPAFGRHIDTATAGTANCDSLTPSVSFPSFLLTLSLATPRLCRARQRRQSPHLPSSVTTERYTTISPLFPRQMNFMEMWWLSVPFALVLCLILSWLSAGDDDINYHESTIMRVSLREFPSFFFSFRVWDDFTNMSPDPESFFFFCMSRESSTREWPPCLYG
jgi:hypothetical protein